MIFKIKKYKDNNNENKDQISSNDYTSSELSDSDYNDSSENSANNDNINNESDNNEINNENLFEILCNDNELCYNMQELINNCKFNI